MCEVLAVSCSGYYESLKRGPSQQTRDNQVVDNQTVQIYTQHRGRYGAPRIHKELESMGKKAGKNRVARRMKRLGLKALAKRKWKATTDSKHALPVADNLLNRDFSANEPNQKWVTDITYVATQEGWLYLATVMDLYSRAIIGWSLHDRLTTSLVIEALEMALWRRKFPKGVLVHSDRGSQYCSHIYQALLQEKGLICSMRRAGECWDNAAMESFYHSLKIELIQFVTGFQTKPEAIKLIVEYIEDYYNTVRRHSAIDYRAPFVFELAHQSS
ncbi:MAG: IS3 family transposase [Gammaproteobacteria bacterium]|nr:IS3 family transposase [Gammaproteobacteria bacterium]